MFFKVVGRVTAGFFNSLGKLFFNIFRGMKKSPIGTVLGLIVVVAVGTLLYATNIFGLTTGNFLGAGNNSGIVRPLEAKPEPDGQSGEFLNALKGANAGSIYNLLSPDYRSLLKQRGISDAKVMQSLMNEKLEEITSQKDGKVSYPSIQFLRGTRYSDGSAQDIYLGTLQSKTTRLQTEYIFGLKNGKITDLQTNDPVAVAALGVNKGESKESAQVGIRNTNKSSTAEKFMVGLTTFDAEKIWESLSDTFKEELKGRGVTKETIVKIFDDQIKTPNAAAGANGSRIGYDGYLYLSTTNFPNGVSANYYTAILSLGATLLEPNYTVVLDSSNKIMRLNSISPEDPIMSALLGKGRGAGQ